MQRFSNRTTFKTFIRSVIFGETTVTLETDDGSFVVPQTSLTLKIADDPQFPYILEYDNSTKLLCGVISPEEAVLYRLNDDQVRQVSQSVEHLSRLTLNGLSLDINEALPLMMDNLEEIYVERLRRLPELYLNEYYVYEVKVSYLASNLGKPVVFDTTPQEMMHSMALVTSQSPSYPPFVQKTYS